MKHSYAFFTAAAFAAFTLACGNQETQVVENFFRAVKAKDNQTVASFSTVQFDQAVESWKVKTVGEEQRSPAPLATMAAGLKTTDEALAENKKNEVAYFNSHPLEVDRVKPLVESGATIPANLQKTATEWKKFIETDKDLKSKATEAQQAYARERRFVAMSVAQGGAPDSMVGDVITKTVMVDVVSGGATKAYAIQLRKYDVAPGGQGAKVMSRWLIQSITPQ